jgi:hypothetical protein
MAIAETTGVSVQHQLESRIKRKKGKEESPHESCKWVVYQTQVHLCIGWKREEEGQSWCVMIGQYVECKCISVSVERRE